MKQIEILEENLYSLKNSLVLENAEKENLQSFPLDQPRDHLGDSIRNLYLGDKKIDDTVVKFEKEYGIWNLEYKLGFLWKRMIDHSQIDGLISNQEEEK
jgi:hypothetical protein